MNSRITSELLKTIKYCVIVSLQTLDSIVIYAGSIPDQCIKFNHSSRKCELVSANTCLNTSIRITIPFRKFFCIIQFPSTGRRI